MGVLKPSHATTNPSHDANGRPTIESAEQRWPVDEEAREWERTLFLQPLRLAESRQSLPSVRRWGGLLLAGLAGLAVLVGEVRAETVTDEVRHSSETDESTNFWAWLLDAMGEDEDTYQTNNGDPTGDPETGEE